jgi:Tfp pilus assembly PilM family ATPase
MNKLASRKAAGLFIDIGQSSLQAVHGDDAFAFPLERAENGRLTDLCRERLALSLRGFLSKKGRAKGWSAFCAIGARGVSMRRLSLPASSEDELRRVLRLQIESEFPLSPDELAWGSRPIGPPRTPANGSPVRQELLVVAVKKEVLEEYAGVLAECGIVPIFTLAALARIALHPLPLGSCAVLDIGRTHSELLSFDNGVPASIRIVAWGGETITRSIQEKMAVSHDEAEKLKMTLDQPGIAFAPQGQLLQNATESALAALAESIKSAPLGEKIYLTGKSARNPRMAPLLAGVLGGVTACESLAPAPGAGPSAAMAGLIKSTGGNGASPPLILEAGGGMAAAKPARPAFWNWATAAVLLALGALFFPYAEAIVLKPFLEKKLAGLEADRGRLATIDQELDFLKFLKQNQPPYLDTIYLMARSAPQGTRLESLGMGRKQQISLRLKMANTQEVSDFREKLIDSGWFANVLVEEQAPSPDRRVSVRMTAELKPAESRKPLAAEPPGKKPERHPGWGGPDFFVPPPQQMMMPPSQPAASPVQGPPGPMPGGPDAPMQPPMRRRPRIIMQPNP